MSLKNCKEEKTRFYRPYVNTAVNDCPDLMLLYDYTYSFVYLRSHQCVVLLFIRTARCYSSRTASVVAHGPCN